MSFPPKSQAPLLKKIVFHKNPAKKSVFMPYQQAVITYIMQTTLVFIRII
ncbi:hypothetical protein ACI0FR_03232 [Paenochrobactrum sp. BZR 201-1]